MTIRFLNTSPKTFIIIYVSTWYITENKHAASIQLTYKHGKGQGAFGLGSE